MARARLTFSTREIKAVIRSVVQATGERVTKVEIGADGRIIVETAPPQGTETVPPQDANPFDEVPGYGPQKHS